MGNPYYIPRTGAVSHARNATGLMNQIAERRLAGRRMDLGERVQGHVEKQDAFLNPIRQQQVQNDTANVETSRMNAQTSRAALPDHKKPFAPSKVVKTKAMFQQKFGKDASNFDGVFGFFDNIAKSGGSNAEALDDALENWGYLQTEFTNGYQKIIEKRQKENPGWINTPEGQETLEMLDMVKSDPNGEKFLGGKMFKSTANSIMNEALLQQAELVDKMPEQWSDPYLDQFGNRVQKDRKTGKEREVSSPPRGMLVRTGPDGETVIQTGVNSSTPIELTTGAQTGFLKEYVENQQALDTIGQIQTLYEPDFLTYPGKAKGAWATFMNKMDPENRSTFQSRRAGFISAANRAFLTFRKWATGVAGGEKEMKEIKRATFSEDDSPQDFEAKIQLAQSLYRRLNARTKAALAAGIDNEAEFQKYIKDHPLDSIPTIQERGDQLQKLNYNEKQIKQILIDEGYISARTK